MKTFLWVSAFIFICSAVYADKGPVDSRVSGKAPLESPGLASPDAAVSLSAPGAIPAKRVESRERKVSTRRAAKLKPVLPPFSPVTAEDFFRAGMQKYYGQDHGAAVSLLCQYVSLFPDDSRVPTALFVVGKGYEAMERHLSALGIFGRIIDQFPQRQEALWSVVAIADLGLGTPSVKYPPFKPGFEYLRDPIRAYDLLLAGVIPPSMREEIMLRKGRALYKQERYPEAYDTFARFLKENPASSSRREAISAVKASTERIIDQSSEAGDHLAAVNVYLQSRRSGLVDLDAFEITLKVVASLVRLGEAEEASNLLEALRKRSQGKGTAQLDRVASDIQKLRQDRNLSGMTPSAEWALFQAGREQLAANERRMAEETLAKLKKPEGDAFWTKLIDYALSEQPLREKYQKYFVRNEKP